MKKNKTIIAAVVLLLVFMVGGAIAYFTDTDSATNTFTIGDIDISIHEDHWVAADGLNLMPGETVAKDPVIKNDSANNPAYVFAEVEVPCTTEATPQQLFSYSVNSGWTQLSSTACAAGKATYVYYYGSDGSLQSLAAGATTTNPVFSEVTLLSTLKGDEAGINDNLNIVVNGYGIQAEGLPQNSTPTTVWGLFS